MIRRFVPFLCFFLCTVLQMYAQKIELVEPPFWWTNMQNERLQLMIYGEDLRDYHVNIDYDFIKVREVHNADSKNYLFIDLEINIETYPGIYSLKLTRENSPDLEIKYELKERKFNSAYREGYSTKDVMYLITPDRFANGDPSNDRIKGMKEGYDRTGDFGRHGGDIKGISDHLDYIKAMGFTCIWLNPVLENDQYKGSYHGYATTDYYKVDPRFGSNTSYVELSHKASEMGICMIMDIIVNHCGSEHWWMQDLPFNDWINFQEEGFIQSNHRKTTLVDPHASKIDRDMMVKGWFVETMPDLNQKNPFMSIYLIQNTIWWIEYADLAGVRQDTYSYPFRDFMKDWTCAIMNEYPNFNIVGEEYVDEPNLVSYWQKGKVNKDGYSSCLPGLMDFPLCFSIHRGLVEKEGMSFQTGLARIYERLAMDYLYPDPDNLVIFPDNHDMSRIYTQLGEDDDLYKMAIAFYLTMRGIPQIYYGTEIKMSNPGTDSHGVIRSDFPGGWAGDKINAFTGNGLDSKQKDAQEFCRNLLQWRKTNTCVQKGKLMHYAPVDGVYTYFRYTDTACVMVVLNKNEKVYTLDPGRFTERLEGYSSARDVITNIHFDLNIPLNLAPRTVYVLELN